MLYPVLKLLGLVRDYLSCLRLEGGRTCWGAGPVRFLDALIHPSCVPSVSSGLNTAAEVQPVGVGTVAGSLMGCFPGSLEVGECGGAWCGLVGQHRFPLRLSHRLHLFPMGFKPISVLACLLPVSSDGHAVDCVSEMGPLVIIIIIIIIIVIIIIIIIIIIINVWSTCAAVLAYTLQPGNTTNIRVIAVMHGPKRHYTGYTCSIMPCQHLESRNQDTFNNALQNLLFVEERWPKERPGKKLVWVLNISVKTGTFTGWNSRKLKDIPIFRGFENQKLGLYQKNWDGSQVCIIL